MIPTNKFPLARGKDNSSRGVDQGRKLAPVNIRRKGRHPGDNPSQPSIAIKECRKNKLYIYKDNEEGLSIIHKSEVKVIGITWQYFFRLTEMQNVVMLLMNALNPKNRIIPVASKKAKYRSSAPIPTAVLQ